MILNYFNITFANNLQLFFFPLYSLSQSSLLTIICVKFPNLSKYRLLTEESGPYKPGTVTPGLFIYQVDGLDLLLTWIWIEEIFASLSWSRWMMLLWRFQFLVHLKSVSDKLVMNFNSIICSQFILSTYSWLL